MLQSAIGARLAKTGKSRVVLGRIAEVCFRKQVLDTDGKGANPLACRMVDGVRHGRVCADISEFA